MNVALRSERFVRHVDERMGATSARIFESMLFTLEVNLRRCYEPWPDAPVPTDEDEEGAAADDEEPTEPQYLITSRELAKKLGDGIDLLDGLDPDGVIEALGSNRFKYDAKFSLQIIDEKLKFFKK